MTVEQDLASIQARLSRAQSARARAEYEWEQAAKRLEAAKAALLEEFGVSTADDIKALLTSLEMEYSDALVAIEAELENAGG